MQHPSERAHPATLCWCGHAVAVHQDARRTTVGGCRAQQCPCSLYRPEDDQIPARQLSDLLVGITVTIGCVLGRHHGRVAAVAHDETFTLVRFRSGREFHVQNHIPVTISLDWSDP